jgi:NADH:ubiquinone oxidoreductase subunit B-like Fe-S oxidoreductase
LAHAVAAAEFFGQNYASLGGVDKVLPVDVFVPGCPPNPHALLHGFYWR